MYRERPLGSDYDQAGAALVDLLAADTDHTARLAEVLGEGAAAIGHTFALRLAYDPRDSLAVLAVLIAAKALAEGSPDECLALLARSDPKQFGRFKVLLDAIEDPSIKRIIP